MSLDCKKLLVDYATVFEFGIPSGNTFFALEKRKELVSLTKKVEQYREYIKEIEANV